MRGCQGIILLHPCDHPAQVLSSLFVPQSYCISPTGGTLLPTNTGHQATKRTTRRGLDSKPNGHTGCKTDRPLQQGWRQQPSAPYKPNAAQCALQSHTTAQGAQHTPVACGTGKHNSTCWGGCAPVSHMTVWSAQGLQKGWGPTCTTHKGLYNNKGLHSEQTVRHVGAPQRELFTKQHTATLPCLPRAAKRHHQYSLKPGCSLLAAAHPQHPQAQDGASAQDV